MQSWDHLGQMCSPCFLPNTGSFFSQAVICDPHDCGMLSGAYPVEALIHAIAKAGAEYVAQGYHKRNRSLHRAFITPSSTDVMVQLSSSSLTGSSQTRLGYIGQKPYLCTCLASPDFHQPRLFLAMPLRISNHKHQGA